MGDDELEYNPQHVVFRDIFLLMAFGFVAIVILLFPWINPPADDSLKELDVSVGVIVEISWPANLDLDIDLWVKAPDDVPVGYSNLGGQLFNLLRDDLGLVGDFSFGNMEIATTRGVRAGEYIVNLHAYRDSGPTFWPVPVKVKVFIKRDGEKAIVILQGEFLLDNVGQELTVYRFTLDEKYKIILNSIHDLPIQLRSYSGRFSQ